MFVLAELVFKLLIYLGVAAVVGGVFIGVLAKGQLELIRLIRRYMLLGALGALLAVVGNFYAQVGNFAESGWGGMFDTLYIAMLWDSPVGHSVLLSSVALIALIFMLLLNRHTPAGLCLMFGLSVLLSASFSLLGHTAELNLLLRCLLSLHVLLALLWLGSLYPLWQACRHVDIPVLQGLMHRFGVVAFILVAVLLVCGVILAYQLLGSVNAVLNTPYGLLLLTKVGWVAVMLGFAGWHKWRLVPQLTDRVSVLRLQRSIVLESGVGGIVLCVTVLLTTLVGPDVLH